MRGPAPESFATPRLAAERLRFNHRDEWGAIFCDPAVAATLGGVPSVARLSRGFARELRRWDEDGFGNWVFRDRADGRFAGLASLQRVLAGGAAEVALGYSLRPAFWGRGLATEMGRALVGLGSGPLGPASIVSFTLVHNRPSRRVLEKLGFRFEREIRHAGFPHAYYRLGATGGDA